MTGEKVIPLGESAYIVRLSETLHREVSAGVRALAGRIEHAAWQELPM